MSHHQLDVGLPSLEDTGLATLLWQYERFQSHDQGLKLTMIVYITDIIGDS